MISKEFEGQDQVHSDNLTIVTTKLAGITLDRVREGYVDRFGVQTVHFQNLDTNYVFKLRDDHVEKSGTLFYTVRSAGDLSRGLFLYVMRLDLNGQPQNEDYSFILPRDKDAIDEHTSREVIGDLTIEELREARSSLRLARWISLDRFKRIYSDHLRILRSNQ